MRSIILTTVLAFITRVSAANSASDAQDPLDKLLSKVVNNLVDRASRSFLDDDADLDSTTLGKTHPDLSSGTLSSRPISSPSLARPRSSFSQNTVQARRPGSFPVCKATATPVSVGLVGYGLVGKELVDQIESKNSLLSGLDMSVVGVARSSQMYFGSDAPAAASKGDKADSTDLAKFGEHIAQQPGKKIIVDCTADDKPADYYNDWLAAGIDVVTPNKKFGSGPLKRYKDAFVSGQKGCTQFFYEATVGAGLPIITTLQDLRRTGDNVNEVEGIFSGTLSYLFNEGGPNDAGIAKPFSDVIADAASKGFTEPDPRDDLSGLDVQRKTIILARECGLDLELADVPVESLVPAELQTWQPTDEEKKKGLSNVFIEKMKEHDSVMAKRMKEAHEKGEVLRYVGAIDIPNKKASVGLRSFSKSHPFAATKYADNIITFATDRYKERPLVVQGAGAGAAVTAGGVFADVLRAASTASCA